MRYESKKVRRDKIYQKVNFYLNLLLYLGVIFLLIYFFALSNFSKVKKITVTGLQKGESAEQFIEDIKLQIDSSNLMKILGLNNYFVWPSNPQFSHLQYLGVAMTKDFKTRNINFVLEPRLAYANWCREKIEDDWQEEACYWIDRNGVAFERSPLTSGQIILKISENTSSTEFINGERILNETEFIYAKSILETVQKLKLEVESIRLDRILQELRIRSTGGAQIIFSLRFDPAKAAIPALQKFIVNPGIERIRQLDLAVENRAFYIAK